MVTTLSHAPGASIPREAPPIRTARKRGEKDVKKKEMMTVAMRETRGLLC